MPSCRNISASRRSHRSSVLDITGADTENPERRGIQPEEISGTSLYVIVDAPALRQRFSDSHKARSGNGGFLARQRTRFGTYKMGAQYIMASSECAATEHHQFKVNAPSVTWTVQVFGNVSVRQRGWCSKAEDRSKERMFAIALLANSLDVLVGRIQSFLSTRLRPVTSGVLCESEGSESQGGCHDR